MEAPQSDQRPGSPPRRQRACLNCSKAKARCNFQDENIGKYCDRCHRMGIECISQTTKSIRKPRQLKPFISGVASEQTIHGNASFLAAGHTVPPAEPSISLPYSLPEVSMSIPTPESIQTSISQLSYQLQSIPLTQPTYQNYTAPRQTLSTPGSPGNGLTWDQAELALAEFQMKFIPHFPFVTIDGNVGARDLSQHKPFLFRVIILIATRLPLERKKTMQRNVMAYLGHHLLVSEDRSLDLLQGLLVFIAWGDIQVYLDRQITHLIHLAVGYAHNLGITRIPPVYLQRRFIDGPVPDDAREAMYCKDPRVLEAMENFHSSEEQRAYLGCYYLMSVNSSQFARRNSFRSPYVEICTDYLCNMGDSCLDFNLEKVVRLQMIVDKISDLFPLHKDPDKSKAFSFLMNDEMRLLRAQLDKVAESIDHVNPRFSDFWLHYNFLLVKLYEPATYLPGSPLDGSYRTQCLLSCLQAAKSYFTTLFSLPTEGFIFRSFVSDAELVSVVVTASKLLLLRAKGWDLNTARQTLDFSSVMGQLIERLMQARDITKQRCGPLADEESTAGEKDVFTKYIEKLAFCKTWFENRVAGERSLIPTAAETAGFPGNFSVFANQDNQFWLGLLGDVSWNFDY